MKKSVQLYRWFVAAIAAIIIVVVLGSYKFFEIKSAIAFAEAMPEYSETVSAAYPSTYEWSPEIKVLGEVRAPQHVELRNEIGGTIVEIGFAAGSKVEEGQLLLQLDTSEEKARYQTAEANAELASLTLKRQESLKQRNAISQDAIDQAKTELAVSRAQMQEIQAVIDKKTLRAPFDAVSGLHTLERGQYLSPNTIVTSLVGISDTLWVDFTLPQQQAIFNQGDKVLIKASGLEHQGVTESNFIEGKIIASDARISTRTRNLRYRAEIPNQSAQYAIRPGAVVEVSVPMNRPVDALIVPSTAILRDSFQSYVYVLERDEQADGFRAVKQIVSPGPQQENDVVIIDGLETKHFIATEGAFKLHHGILVKLDEASLSSVRTPEKDMAL